MVSYWTWGDVRNSLARVTRSARLGVAGCVVEATEEEGFSEDIIFLRRRRPPSYL